MKKVVLFSKFTYDAILFYFVLKITSVKSLPLLSTHTDKGVSESCPFYVEWLQFHFSVDPVALKLVNHNNIAF